MDELLAASASAQAQLVRQGDISVAALVDAHLARIEEVNTALNAVVTLCADQARSRAGELDAALSRGEDIGVLGGVPVTIKDSFDTAGVLTTGGTLGWRDRVPPTNAAGVQRYLDAGAVLLGKTNTPDLTLWYETDNLLFGRTYNPYDTSKSPGGSSGGAGAILAAGGAALELGSDTGGSIRLPSHFCGVAGFKPSAGRVPRTGLVVPFGTPVDDLTQVGPMARYVEDLELALAVLSGPDGIDLAVASMPPSVGEGDLRSLRVAFYTDNGEMAASDDVAGAVRAAAAVLEAGGAKVSEDVPKGIERVGDLYRRIWVTDGGAWIHRILSEYGSTDSIRLSTEFSDSVPDTAASDWTQLMLDLQAYRSAMAEFLHGYDLILAPAHANPAKAPGELTSADNRPGFTYTQAFNITGWPAAVVRAGTSSRGLPIGVQAVSGPWRDATALAGAKAIERGLGGWLPPEM
ncbi:MAG: amidase [Acidimicrobiia bacterium]|nr:amidase [Acidimicrobiia bacterium]